MLHSPNGTRPRTFVTFKEGIKMKRFYHLWVMAFCSSFFGIYISATFKNFGSENGINDFVLTLSGSIGAVLNGFSRLGWATL